MKLFLVIYMANQIGGVAGPLPYDYDECQSRVQVMRQDQMRFLVTQIDVQTGQRASAEDVERVASLRFECEWHTEKPSISAE